MLNISLLEEPDLIDLQVTVEKCCADGIKIADTTELVNKVRTEYEKYLKELRVVYGINNPNSSQQVLAVFKSLAEREVPEIYDVCYNPTTDKWSSSKENLETLKQMDVPIAKTLSRYRTLNNILSSISTLNSFKDKNGLVHPVVTYGKTGRINYSEPALMNINKKILWNVIAPRNNDSTLYSIDIKQQEPWILVNMLSIESLRSALDPKRGLYESIFKLWFGRDCDSKAERDEFKMAWNALTYGGTKHGLVERCKYIDVDIMYNNFTTIPELKEYKKACTSKGFSGRRTCNTIFGTELTCDAKKGMPLARQHMDYPIQGSGVGILACLNTNLYDSAKAYGYEEFVHPYYFRHDECIVQIDNALIDTIGDNKVIEFLKDTFEHQIDDWVPFNVEISKIEPNEELNFDFDEEA